MASLLLRFLPIALLALAACEPPSTTPEVGAAVVDALPEPLVATPVDLVSLPGPVEATIAQLREIADVGGYRDLARLADMTPDFVSNTAGMSHRDYWYLKLRTGDWPMAHVGRLLDQPHAIVETDRGLTYVWPSLATLPPDEYAPADVRAVDALLGEGQADAIREGAPWPGYVLGIAEDGTWLYFVSGEG